VWRPKKGVKVRASGESPQRPGEATVDPSGVFDRLRPLLFSIAYRMLGSVMDAEDVVQEAYLRWQRASETEVRSPRAYLSAVVTRLCIDQLRSAKARREEYLGPWLPEPLPTEPAPDAAVLEESLSMAFLVLLESLNPTERAVFLLREVFDYDYGEISYLVDKSEENCRQIARRARQSVAARRPRFESSPEQEERLMGGFLEACFGGDMERLLALLSEDVTLWSDGGGKTRAALRPIHGADKVARFFSGILRKAPPGFVVRRASINGRPGLIGYVEDGRPQSVATFDVAEGSIRAIRLAVNPEKLRAVPPLSASDAEGRS
jgi:RNA polymerase sigma-70 factor, ECF subfamily